MTLDPVLAEAREFDGQSMFWPPGHHPATARLRYHARCLESEPPSAERNEALAYVLDRLSTFEEGESIAKADYLRRAR